MSKTQQKTQKKINLDDIVKKKRFVPSVGTVGSFQKTKNVVSVEKN